jgi:uncharacterized phiE125 gp8 family phage protein
MIRLEPMRPGETRDYLHDWSPFLGEDTIASEVTVGSGVTVSAHAIEDDDKSVRFTFAAVTAGLSTITHTITTAGGQIEKEVFTLWILSAEEPVSVAEAKDHLRILDDDSRDASIAGMITRAREWVEDFTGLILVRREITDHYPTWPDTGLVIHKRPVLSIEGVTSPDSEGEPVEYEGFAPALYRRPVVVLNTGSLPSLPIGGDYAVTYVAGLAEGEAPERCVGAILALVEGEWSEGTAWSPRAIESAERCCGQLRSPVLS